MSIVKERFKIVAEYLSELNTHQIPNPLYYNEYSQLNQYFNDLKPRRDTLNGWKPQLNKIFSGLYSLSQILTECSSDIQTEACTVDLSQLVKNAELFNDFSEYVNSASTIVNGLGYIKENISSLMSACNSRKEMCEMVIQKIDQYVTIVDDSVSRLSTAYSTQLSKKLLDEMSYVEDGETVYVYASEGRRIKHPKPLSLEEWWDLSPYEF